MKKRVLSLLLACCMLAAVLSTAALAADVAESGTCGAEGDNLTWEIDSEGTLTIRGTGEMKNFSSVSSMLPWYGVKSRIKAVVIEDGVTSIGSYAFNRCTGVAGVTIAGSVTSIGKWAFYNCSSLTDVTLPASVTSFGEDAFGETPWLASLGEFAQVNGVLLAYQGAGGDVVIPDSVTTIGDYSFVECSSMTSLTIPDGVTTLESWAFGNCESLESVTIPASVTTIGAHAFATDGNLASVTIVPGKEPVTIGERAFYSTALKEVTVPGNVTDIGSSAFASCYELTRVTICDGVASIGDEAFCRGDRLAEVTIPASVTAISDSAFQDCGGSLTICGPEGSYAESYAEARGIPYQIIVDQGSGVDITVAAKFTDVDVSDPENWYALPVAWAVVNGITQGTSETAFSPDGNCTRAQIVTFLYRAAGQPDVDKNGAAKFTDVDLDEYYAPAVAWAVENNITVGTTGTTFSPEDACTRAQIVTFLWRYEGEPAAADANAFTDVAEGEYYAAAVNWAVANKITVGTTETTFSPEEYCTRAQIVTFLYRDMAV